MPIDWTDPNDPEPGDEPVTLDVSKLPSPEEMDRILQAKAPAAKRLSPMDEYMMEVLREKYPRATPDELQRMIDRM